MLIEEAVYTIFKGNEGISGMIGNRIYPVTMPQLEKGKTFYPALVFNLDSRERQQSHDGPTGLVKSHIQAVPLGPKYFEVKQLADKVRLALDGKRVELQAIYGEHVRGIMLESESDDYVFDEIEELGLYNIPMLFSIQHKEET